MGYRNEWGVILINHGDKVFTVHQGDRIAQVVFNKFEKAEFELTDSFEETDRKGGWGSTGVSS